MWTIYSYFLRRIIDETHFEGGEISYEIRVGLSAQTSQFYFLNVATLLPNRIFALSSSERLSKIPCIGRLGRPSQATVCWRVSLIWNGMRKIFLLFLLLRIILKKRLVSHMSINVCLVLASFLSNNIGSSMPVRLSKTYYVLRLSQSSICKTRVCSPALAILVALSFIQIGLPSFVSSN